MSLRICPVMCDWLKVYTPDPFGVPIYGSEIVRFDNQGEVEFAVKTRREFEGSHSSKIFVRNLLSPQRPSGRPSYENGFELDGNPQKFLFGHNLAGTDDPKFLLDQTLERVAEQMALSRHPNIDLGQSRIARIDVTGNWLLPRPSDVIPFLLAMRDYVHIPYKGTARYDARQPGTLYYGAVSKGKRAKAWQFKLYHKGAELASHPIPQKALAIPGLLDEAMRTIRVELKLTTTELKRQGLLTIDDWPPGTAEQVWKTYVGKMDFGAGEMVLDNQDLEGTVKPRLMDAIASWKAGNDLRVGRSSSSFYRLAKQIREATGLDITSDPPKSNIIPLMRVVEAKPAGVPHWADALHRVMSSAA